MSTEALKILNQMHHDLIVTMQAAYIEWRHGGGAEQAMLWIANTLDGPSLIPDESEPFGKEAQAYFDANRAEPFPAQSALTGEQITEGWRRAEEGHLRTAFALFEAGVRFAEKVRGIGKQR